MKKFVLSKFYPCSEGLEYYESKATPEQAWNDCQRGDWMLWIAHKLNVDDRIFTRAKALCANTVRYLMVDDCSKDAVDAALRYADGEISREELDKYAVAASFVSYGSTIFFANTFAASAASAASSVGYSDSVAIFAAEAVFAAFTYLASVKEANQKKTADICRKVLTDEVFSKITIILEK
jgi:hypothetical protein